jgi:hypothetical protein
LTQKEESLKISETLLSGLRFFHLLFFILAPSPFGDESVRNEEGALREVILPISRLLIANEIPNFLRHERLLSVGYRSLH